VHKVMVAILRTDILTRNLSSSKQVYQSLLQEFLLLYMLYSLTAHCQIAAMAETFYEDIHKGSTKTSSLLLT
jgi:hypothetical protein